MPSDDSTEASSGSSDAPAGSARIGWRLWALLGANFVSLAMMIGQVTILGKQVFDMTGEELHLGFIGLAGFVPTALLAPFSGVVADRYERRIVYACGLAGEALASIGMYLYVATEPTSVLPIFALVVAFGSARAFLTAASRALPVDMAPPGGVERMVALSGVAWQAGVIVGPVAFGFVFVAGPEFPYLLAACGSMVAIGLLTLVPSGNVQRARSTAGASAREAFNHAFEGLRFIRVNRILLGIMSLDLFAVLFGGAVALLPAIAEKRLGVGAVGLGWLRAAEGVGASIVMVLLAVRPLRHRVGPILMAVVAMFGLGTIALGLTRSYLLAFGALMVLAAADAVSMFIRSTLVPLATPEEMRGRVLAVEWVFIGGSNELGAFESGVAGALLGVAGAVVFGGVGTLAVVAVWWFLFPEIGKISSFAQVRPDR